MTEREKQLEMALHQILDIATGRTNSGFALNDIRTICRDNLKQEINGWTYYRNEFHGKMVAHHKVGRESLTFQTDESFDKWFKAEREM